MYFGKNGFSMIDQGTIDFLVNLREHNSKEWFDENRKTYEGVRDNFKKFVQQLIEGMTNFDPTLEGQEAKNSIFRINRDIRFSKNKNPYKTNIGAHIVKGGKKSNNAGYYLHIEPDGKSAIAGGSYMPSSEVLTAIRKGIDYDPTPLKEIINSDSFKHYFGELHGERLKTAPKGFPKDHPEIDLLRFKSFTVWHAIPDDRVIGADFMDFCLEVFSAMKPLIDFLNQEIKEVTE